LAAIAEDRLEVSRRGNFSIIERCI
jgi:hypothetical protein